VIEPGLGETGATSIPEASNVLDYLMTDGSVFQIRPSGTEPTVKVYFGVTAETREGAEALLEEFKGAVSETVAGILGASA
jgi:phosphoglucomutase